ncbi:hypothetical protein sos41_28690 [Alphaproteobacteria bacterium SO-S41]|nr:hypothetical protein sos41_28690 [Alphaproteobacteria bacterium SO-S41]
MKSLLLATVFVLAAAATPAFAADPAAVAPVALTPAETGTAVSVATGGTLTLTLPARGGVPYAWEVTSVVEPQLIAQGQETVAKIPGRAGGPADVVITFSADAPGTVELTAGLFPFTGEKTAVQTVTYTVTVTP